MKTSLLFGLLARLAVATLDGSRYLWYTQPGRYPIFEDGMPIGNGRVAGTIYGGGAEVIGINENSIWTGPFQDRIASDPQAALPVVREMLLNGQMSEGRELAMQSMISNVTSPRSYSYFGNINIDFGHQDSAMTDYIRWLDTKEGTTGISYKYNGVTYTREYVASYPQGVLIAKFTSSKPGNMNMNVTMSRINNYSVTASAAEDGDTVTLQGSSGQAASQDPIRWTGQARFVTSGGSISATGPHLVISGATEVEMYFDAETSFRYSTQAAWEAEMKRKISNACSLGYDIVKAEAIADASDLLNRVTLDLGDSPDGLADLPTDQRITIARNSWEDLQLSTLVFNFGRHLLVASSRNTGSGNSLPANLQGIWNNSTSAPWGGKYTININIEMNYWPAGTTNLIETLSPLFDLMAAAKKRGESYAQRMYGCPGTVFHHNLDLWGDPAPTDNYTASTMWPMGAAWLSWHMMDYYYFTLDKQFLKDVAYPFLVDLAAFYECYTFEYDGYNVTGPSLSPENNFLVPANQSVPGAKEAVDIAPAMDGQLMTDAFNSLLEAASVLGVSDSDTNVKAAKDFLPTIRPQQIGSLGQILEWRHEYTESAIGQKHLSPLYSLMPGRQFSPLIDSTLSKAAGVLLNRRVSHGSGTTGWSRTWLINMFARIFDGDSAWEQLTQWFSVYPTPYNLYNTNEGPDGPYQFQIDGNFGFVSGVTEMLLQSHAGVVHLLPALPGAVPKGSVKGLAARGNFVVDIAWEDGKMTKATILSRAGADLKLRYMDGQAISVNGAACTGTIATREGATYVITPA